MTNSRLLSVALFALALAPRAAFAQCEPPRPGVIGVGMYHCVGGVCWISDEPEDRYFRFGTEPLLRELSERARESGLEEKDVLVAVEGIPVTIPEAGRRLGNLEPGQPVRLTVRRAGRLHDLSLLAHEGCSIGGLAVTSDTVFPRRRLRLQGAEPPNRNGVRPETAGRLEGLDPDVTGSLGIGVSCGRCGWVRDEGGTLRWSAGEPLEVIYLDAPGPARRAGIQVGDVVTHIDGQPVTSRAGADLLSSIAAERTYRLRVERGGEVLQIDVDAVRIR